MSWGSDQYVQYFIETTVYVVRKADCISTYETKPVQTYSIYIERTDEEQRTNRLPLNSDNRMNVCLLHSYIGLTLKFNEIS